MSTQGDRKVKGSGDTQRSTCQQAEARIRCSHQMILMDLKIMVLSVEKSNRMGSTAHHPACQLKRMQTKHNTRSAKIHTKNRHTLNILERLTLREGN